MVAIAGLAALLAGCAGTGDTGVVAGGGGAVAGVTGNERGGRIPNGINDVPASTAAAQSHCAQFKKRAIFTEMKTVSEGGLIAFECR